MGVDTKLLAPTAHGGSHTRRQIHSVRQAPPHVRHCFLPKNEPSRFFDNSFIYLSHNSAVGPDSLPLKAQKDLSLSPRPHSLQHIHLNKTVWSHAPLTHTHTQATTTLLAGYGCTDWAAQRHPPARLSVPAAWASILAHSHTHTHSRPPRHLPLWPNYCQNQFRPTWARPGGGADWEKGRPWLWGVSLGIEEGAF